MLWTTLPILALATSAQAAISILYPRTDSTWFKNDTVALNWTQSNPAEDTYFFRTILSNADTSFYGQNQSIADQTNATATYVRILLPGVPSGGGYIVSLVNTTNPAQEFARSEQFKIEDGAVATSTTPPTTQTGSSSSGGGIPNVNPTSNANPFATSIGAAVPLKPLGMGIGMGMGDGAGMVGAVSVVVLGAMGAGLGLVL